MGTDTSPLEGVTTWRWEGGRWQQDSGSRRKEWPDNLRGRERDWSRERPPEERARTDQDQGRERFPLHRREYPLEEYEWATRDERFGRWVWQRSALDPQLEVCPGKPVRWRAESGTPTGRQDARPQTWNRQEREKLDTPRLGIPSFPFFLSS